MSDERRISERYRRLPPEEPPRHVDDAILAAARRAAGTRPAPLVVPTGRQRWYFPLAAAAIIVLAVAVTMHVERQQPDPEAQIMAPASEPEPANKDYATPAERKTEPPRVFAPDPKPVPPKKEPRADEAAGSRDSKAKRETAPLSDLQKATPPAAAPPSPPRDAVGRASEAPRADTEARAQARNEAQQAPAAARARQAQESTVANYAMQPPEQALQGIADLRRQGRHEEADKALAEFRKRYPDYQISEEMRAKVERR